MVRARQHLGQGVPVEDVVAENERDPVRADELGPNDKGVGEAPRPLLNGVSEAQSQIGAIPEQALKEGLVLGGGDDQYVSDPGEHESRQGIVDHRLVEHRQQLLGNDSGHGIEPCSRPTGKYDPLHLPPLPCIAHDHPTAGKPRSAAN